VLSAALANAGMMGLILLASGWVYQNLGGAVPLSTFDAAVLPPLLAMAITAHLLNDAIMAALYALRGGRARELFSLFPTVVEWVSFLVAILVAIFYNTARGTGEIVLALLVLLLGMIAVRRLALLRQSLEQQVAERTRELREKTVELDRLVQEDVLTGLKNRRHLDQRLGPELQRAIRYGRALSVAIGDLDHFKRINDEYSHAAGDEALRQVAQILRRSARESDIVARYGGEEFVLCLPETDGAQALALCERLRQEIASHDWSTISPGLRVTISFGIAVLAPRIIDPDRLMAEADHCLYAAKRAGRNRVIAAAEAGAAPA
jgi:diguanylate cyclase (GGDEF)-like protein